MCMVWRRARLLAVRGVIWRASLCIPVQAVEADTVQFNVLSRHRLLLCDALPRSRTAFLSAVLSPRRRCVLPAASAAQAS